MNTASLARHYGQLTPEERFCLILAASARGDEAERDRLAHAAQRVTLTTLDHSPYAHAFDELALLIFIELIADAAGYLDAIQRADDVPGSFDDEVEEEERDEPEAELALPPEAEQADETAGRPSRQRTLDMVLAAGYLLRTRANAWELFCEQLNAAPFLLWEGLPGFHRLKCALALTEKAAFTPEGFLCWLNEVRPAGEPERTQIPLTAEGLSDATTKLYQQRVESWGG